MTKGNGKSAPVARGDMMTIAFARPIKDGRGQMRDELSEAEASWSMKLQRLVAAEPVQVEGSIVGAPAQVRQKVVPVYVPIFEIVQNLGDGRAVLLQVPQELCVVRVPVETVEVRDASGEVVEKKVMRCSEARAFREEQARRAALIRGDAAEH